MLVLALTVLLSPVALSLPFSDADSSKVDYSKSRHQPASSCRSLMSLTTVDFSVVTASLESGAVEFCAVSGVIPSEIRFAVDLPTNWNGRLFMHGNGGLAGTPPESPGRRRTSQRALQYGFATSYTDTGHDRRIEQGGSFAYRNLHKLIDYGYRAVHLTAQTAKLLTEKYYGDAPAYSYFMGCSTGGRQALMSAQRFPNDFNGIIAGAPANDYSGLKFSQAWRMTALKERPLDRKEIEVLADRIYRQCDALDGLKDGLIDDPRNCPFDAEKDLPGCDGADAVTCFTDQEIAALKQYYASVKLAGRTIYPGHPVGSEVSAPGYDGIARPDNLTQFRDIVDAVDPDLRPYRDSGGKLISYFGWADPDINPLTAIDYHDAVDERVGGNVNDFYRLFIVPGMFHCAGGPGPDVFDVMTPLINWVEAEQTPASISTEHKEKGETQYSRPLCPYPQVARLQSGVDPNDANSFRCIEKR
jgi:feruloyl esterase